LAILTRRWRYRHAVTRGDHKQSAAAEHRGERRIACPAALTIGPRLPTLVVLPRTFKPASGQPAMSDSTGAAGQIAAPHPGSKAMPRWDSGPLIDAPRFTWRSWPLLLGPGLVMGASAIGGGEWLTGPLTTARYGGALL
jgi:hypothetical protein